MSTLFLLLFFIFTGVALMVVLGERFANPIEEGQAQRLSRWIMPLVGVALVLSLLKHLWN